MLDCIIRRNLTALVALSSDVLGNPVLVTDSALAVLAAAPSDGGDDGLASRIVSPDFRPEEFRKLVQPEPGTAGSGVRVLADSPLSEVTLAVCTIDVSRTYAVHIVMTCLGPAASQGLLDLFDLFLGFAGIYFRSGAAVPPDCSRSYDSLVADIIEGRVASPSAVRSRCEYSGLRNGAYTLLRFQFGKPEKAPFQRIMEELSLLFPEAKLTLYGQSVAMIRYAREDQAGAACADFPEGFAELLRRYDTVCGVSGLMRDIVSLRAAYEQTEAAVEYGRRVQKNRLLSVDELRALSLKPEQGIFSFEDYYMYRIIDGGYQQSELLYANARIFCALSKLWLSDKISRLNNLKLLYVYLLTERQCLLTGKVLHMHRNNVFYHVTKIGEQLGISLDDPSERTRLLTAYQALDLYGADYLGTSDYYKNLDMDILEELGGLKRNRNAAKLSRHNGAGRTQAPLAKEAVMALLDKTREGN